MSLRAFISSNPLRHPLRLGTRSLCQVPFQQKMGEDEAILWLVSGKIMGKSTKFKNIGVKLTLKIPISSCCSRATAEVEVGGNTNGMDFGFKGYSMIGSQYYTNCSLACQSTAEGLRPGLGLVVGRRIDGNSIWKTF